MSTANNYTVSPIASHLRKSLEVGFEEDIGFGDITSLSVLPSADTDGNFIAKSNGVISGIDALTIGYEILDPSVDVTLHVNDGDSVKKGDRLAHVEGAVQSLLTGERVILNILQHMSGIATKTTVSVKELDGSGIRVCDTRKTLPGLRALQKYAVRCGGGFNHRMRLDDGVMIKDNHITAAGSISNAVNLARQHAGLMVKIEVECETEAQVKEALKPVPTSSCLTTKPPSQRKDYAKWCLITLLLS